MTEIITGVSLLERDNERKKILPYYYEEFNEDVKQAIHDKLDHCLGEKATDFQGMIAFVDDVCESTHPDVVAAIVDYIEDLHGFFYDHADCEWAMSYNLMKLRTIGDPDENWINYHPKGFKVGPKILGLDIDGVLNTFRGSMTSGWGGINLNQILRDPDAVDKFDQFGLNFLRQLCKKSDVQILLVTQQRIGIKDLGIRALSMFLDLPIVGKTRSFGARKDEILEWLNNHPQVQQFASVDDEYYYVDINKAAAREPSELNIGSTHIRIDQHNGILWHDMCRVSEFFGVNIRDLFVKQK